MAFPEPMTDDELQYANNWPVHPNDLASVLIARLVATVDQARRERDAAYAVIRKFCTGWQIAGETVRNGKTWTQADADAFRAARAITEGAGGE